MESSEIRPVGEGGGVGGGWRAWEMENRFHIKSANKTVGGRHSWWKHKDEMRRETGED